MTDQTTDRVVASVLSAAREYRAYLRRKTEPTFLPKGQYEELMLQRALVDAVDRLDGDEPAGHPFYAFATMRDGSERRATFYGHGATYRDQLADATTQARAYMMFHGAAQVVIR